MTSKKGFGDTLEAPRVSPKPYARSRTARPPTVDRPASAIPLSETCAASETRRVARLRAASCATPASLPLRAHGTASRGRFGGGRRRGLPSAQGQRRRGGVAESFSGPTGPATRRFTSRGRCGSEGQRLRSPRGVLSEGARKSSERTAPRATAADKESVCHCPVRKSGIRVPCSLLL